MFLKDSVRIFCAIDQNSPKIKTFQQQELNNLNFECFKCWTDVSWSKTVINVKLDEKLETRH